MSAAPLKVESKVGSKAEVNINVDLLLMREFVLYMCAYMLACEYERILSLYHSIGSPIDGAHQVRRPIEIIWAVTVRRPLKRQRERKKVVPPGIEPRASGLSHQCSATKLRHPPTTTSLSFPYIALLVRIIVDRSTFQRSTDSNGPDYLYRSSDLVSPIYRAPNAVI